MNLLIEAWNKTDKEVDKIDLSITKILMVLTQTVSSHVFPFILSNLQLL